MFYVWSFEKKTQNLCPQALAGGLRSKFYVSRGPQYYQFSFFLVTGEPGSVQVVTGDTVAHPTYVQYVDETPEAATIYTTTNGQM